MKFVIAAVVLIAVASGVQSSLIAGAPVLGLGLGLNAHGLGLGINGLGLGINGLGLGLAGQSLVQGPALLGAGIIPQAHLPAAVNVVSSPALIGLGSHAGIAAPLALGHGASYVAKTRGAIHTAPLPGHINSAASVNLAPAPGTW